MSQSEAGQFDVDPKILSSGIGNAFFLDQEMVEILKGANLHTIGHLAVAAPESLSDIQGMSARRLEAVARLLEVMGIDRGDIMNHITEQGRFINKELLVRYREVGIALPGELYLYELREPNRVYDPQEHLRWLQKENIKSWRDLQFQLVKEQNPEKRWVSMMVSAAGGTIAERPPEDAYLKLNKLREHSIDSLVALGAASKWRGIHKYQASVLLTIFKP